MAIVSENEIRIVGSNDNIRSTFGPKATPRPWFANLFKIGAQGRDRTTRHRPTGYAGTSFSLGESSEYGGAGHA